MTKTKRYLLLAVAACLLIALTIGITACGGKKNDTETTGPAAIGTVGTENLTYTLVLKTEGGKPMEGIGVYFYTDHTKAELTWFAKTDAEGKASFTDLASDNYVAVLDGVPEGYQVEEYYPLTGETTEVILSAGMSDGDLANITYELGDAVLNFSVTTADGTVYVLSELLQEKQAVVLNFWYLQCAPCRMEFPYLQEAYEKYSEKIEVLALNPINNEPEAIEAFREELGLTFPMAYCDPNWEKAMQLTAYPTTVIIDRYGSIALIHKGSVTEAKVFEDAFEFFTADDYEQTVVEDIAELEIKEAGSDSENPIEIGGKTSFQVTVKPGQLVYYHLYRLDGMYLSIKNEYAYAVYNDYTYKASGGSLGFTVNCPDTFTPAKVAFGNSGTETQIYNVTLSAKPGTFNNPHTLKLGEFTTKVESGNDQGVYYLYTAKEDGRLTVQCTDISKNVKYDYTLQNQNTMAVRTIREDGDEEEGTVSISVKKGHKVMLTIGTLPDDSNSYPGATFTSVASMGEDTGDDGTSAKKIDYAITVTDENRKPLSGVFLNVKSVEQQTEESTEETTETETTTTTPVSVSISTNEEGVATTKQPEGDYDVTVSLIPGYTAATTKFRLTKDNPFVSIKLEPLVVEKKNYTITVVDEQGNPVVNATVTMGGEVGYTDANGNVTFELPVASYTVTIVTEEATYTSPVSGDQADVNIDLSQADKVETGPEGQTKDYLVTVQDYAGNPRSGVTVQFLKEGIPASVVQTDASGKAAATLESADYSVALAFADKGWYYEEKSALLPVGTTELTIKVANGVSGTPEELYVGNAYYLNVGGTYVTMQAEVVNYYIFEPTEPGLYRIGTSDPEAKIGYYGGSTFFIADMTSSTDYTPENNYYTRNIKQGNIGGVIIIGVTGAQDAIIEIIRMGDPILDETDIVPDVYEGKTTPTKVFKIKAADGKKLKYVDLKGKTSDYQIVLGSDGYYHLNSANGPLLYMNLGPSAPYISMYNMLGYTGFGGTSLTASFYDANGSVVRREDYTACMCSYVENIDPTYGVYPLTEDLVYMMQNGGGYKGWWNPDSANCIFLDEEKVLDPTINLELGWMFAVCYVP